MWQRFHGNTYLQEHDPVIQQVCDQAERLLRAPYDIAPEEYTGAFPADELMILMDTYHMEKGDPEPGLAVDDLEDLVQVAQADIRKVSAVPVGGAVLTVARTTLQYRPCVGIGYKVYEAHAGLAQTVEVAVVHDAPYAVGIDVSPQVDETLFWKVIRAGDGGGTIHSVGRIMTEAMLDTPKWRQRVEALGKSALISEIEERGALMRSSAIPHEPTELDNQVPDRRQLEYAASRLATAVPAGTV